MLYTKIVSCLFGLALLVPLTASFWMMIRYQRPSPAELQESLKEAMSPVQADIDAQVEPGSPVAMSALVQISEQQTLPILGPQVWVFSPRFWVGVVGLASCFLIALLWIYSTFFIVVSISGEHGKSGMEEMPDTSAGQGQIILQEVPVDQSRLIFRGDQGQK